MRKLLAAALACGCVFGAAHAGDRDDALAFIDQAIQAQGGADALAKARTAVRSGEGALYVGGDKQSFTDEMTLDLPDRWRDSIEIEKKLRVNMAISGDKGWQAVAGTVNDIGPERLKELRDEMYVLWLQTLLPLKKDGFDLATLPEAKVNDRPAVGVKATSKGHAEAKLYFDKDTHLLAKIERTATVAGLALSKEYLYSDYKEFDGVKMPTRVVEMQEAKKASELTSASYKFPSKPDDAAFAKP